MTYILGQEKPSLEDLLEHHGVKGMHWGVRRKNLGDIGTTKLATKRDRNVRVASGKSSSLDKARVAVSTPVGRLATRGLKGAAAKNAEKLNKNLEYINKGEPRVRDILAKYRSVSARDLARVSMNDKQRARYYETESHIKEILVQKGSETIARRKK